MKFLLSFSSSIFNPKQTILCGIQKGLKSFKVPAIFNISHTTTFPALPWSFPGAPKYIGIFEVHWMMLATLKILTWLIFKHLDAMAAPKLVLKCSASRNSHRFPSCISQLRSRNLNLTPLRAGTVQAILNLLPSNTGEAGEKKFSRFLQYFQRNKMQKIFFI